MSVLAADFVDFELTVPVLIVGAGACGLVAVLAAAEGGTDIVVIERDALPAGSTALSSGMIPAAGTSIQRAHGIDDTPELLAQDILAKCRGEADRDAVETVARFSAPTIDWLVDEQGVELTLVEGFLYPGHSRLRMHAPPDRAGATLMASLAAAAGRRTGIEILTDAHVTALYADDSQCIAGVRVERPDGGGEDIGCRALVLASSGFGGNRDMVRRYIPDMAEAYYFGHQGNQGDAVRWGLALGAEARHMGAYQGHGSVAQPEAVLVTWALMMEGGIQVNAEGKRFSNEHQGYSEQSVAVLAQPGGVAWNVFDARLDALGRDGFEDYRRAAAAGAIRTAASPAALAETLGLPADVLAATLAETRKLAAGSGACPFGRDFTAKPALDAPYFAVRVTGALFHTQGGLAVDGEARVRRPDGSVLPNLMAGGGAACGVSGAGVAGYLSGNGLLTACVYGRLAGRTAARLASFPAVV